MKQEVQQAIECLVSEITNGVDADKALKISQAALNLANCQAVISQTAINLAIRKEEFVTPEIEQEK